MDRPPRRCLGLALAAALLVCSAHAPAHAQAPGPRALDHARGVVHAAHASAPTVAPGDAEVRLALALYDQGEDWRAISALWRWSLGAGDDHTMFLAQLMMGQIYQRNLTYPFATRAYLHAAAVAPHSDAEIWAQLLALGPSCPGLDAWPECDAQVAAWLPYLHTMPPGQARAIALTRRALDVVFRRPATEFGGHAELGPHASLIAAHDARFDELSPQRPWLAATLSAVLPGAGQAYNGRWGDAALALGLNAGLGWATYYSITQAESVPWSIASGLALAGFYTGNVVNAYVDARRLNEATYTRYFDQLKALWPRVSFAIDGQHVQFGLRFDWPGPTTEGQILPPRGAKPRLPSDQAP